MMKRILVLGLLALAACGRQQLEEQQQGSVVINDTRVQAAGATAAGATAAAADSCRSTATDGEALSTDRSLVEGVIRILVPPSSLPDVIPASDALAKYRASGLRPGIEATARCTEYLLGIFQDKGTGVAVDTLAWVIIFHQFGPMANPKLPISYQQAVVVNATTGELVTTVEYPSHVNAVVPTCTDKADCIAKKQSTTESASP